MFLVAFIGILAAQLASGVSGRQIPVVDGILGGIRSGASSIKENLRVEPSARTPGQLRVTENSGICETTKGVYQASGYGDLTSSESIWCVTKPVYLFFLLLMSV
jgi:hypothetical protein